METYILILTLAFKAGSAGMGGVTALELPSSESCHRVGSKWVEDFKKVRGRTYDKEVIYTCTRK